MTSSRTASARMPPSLLPMTVQLQSHRFGHHTGQTLGVTTGRDHAWHRTSAKAPSPSAQPDPAAKANPSTPHPEISRVNQIPARAVTFRHRHRPALRRCHWRVAAAWHPPARRCLFSRRNGRREQECAAPPCGSGGAVGTSDADRQHGQQRLGEYLRRTAMSATACDTQTNRYVWAMTSGQRRDSNVCRQFLSLPTSPPCSVTTSLASIAGGAPAAKPEHHRERTARARPAGMGKNPSLGTIPKWRNSRPRTPPTRINGASRRAASGSSARPIQTGRSARKPRYCRRENLDPGRHADPGPDTPEPAAVRSGRSPCGVRAMVRFPLSSNAVAVTAAGEASSGWGGWHSAR